MPCCGAARSFARTRLWPLAVLCLLCGCIWACSDTSVATTPNPPPTPVPQTLPTAFVPLTDMGSNTYLGFAGGLYPGGDSLPTAHRQTGLDRANSVTPLDSGGNTSSTGKYVLLSIGMSNTTQEFCSRGSALPCDSWTFMGKALADSAVNTRALVIVNGARGGQASAAWESPDLSNYDRIRDERLGPLGLSEKQVQIVWLKTANPGPSSSLPDQAADAFTLVRQMGNIVGALKTRYPNLRQVFLSSRIYAGFATTTLNPEPYAYESGFAVKWLIQAQIDQMANGGAVVDTTAGDLNYDNGAPWIGWGPYLWANGTEARSDGLVWLQSDFEGDGTHPAQSAEAKVGSLLLEFFKTSELSVAWFLR